GIGNLVITRRKQQCKKRQQQPFIFHSDDFFDSNTTFISTSAPIVPHYTQQSYDKTKKIQKF
ncbi:MAG: hypothetical protein IKZ18_00655, partial [Bacteroidaceae bacterium]|nr:hypothetical protein [Bacteroidaceae bacterium]